MSADGRVLVFSSDRRGSYGLYITTRAQQFSPFGEGTRIEELDTSDVEEDPWISPDKRYLLFTLSMPDGSTIMQASR